MSLTQKLIAACVVIFFLLFGLSSNEIIEIEDGKIEGILMQTRRGENFHAFVKIPFAEPPLAELRFKPPVAKEKWPEVLNCTVFGPMCMQEDDFGNEISENCLHLNVFTKNLPTDESTELKPVIAFIHGGGFGVGSAIEHGPEYLMEREIVLVTIQYRLGAFGFLALETLEASGNQGLKDQSLAFEWIRSNIRHFGGDPEKVTIAGLSAGGFSVTGHMLSPMSNGLFKNVIAVSGALAWQKKLKSNNIEAARELAQKCNCSTENIESMTNCLVSTPAEIIVTCSATSFFHCPIMTWVPVIEPDLGQERFLTDQPNDLFRSGNFSRVNVMTGITADEFIKPAAEILASSNLTQLLNENFDSVAPACFFFEANEHHTAEAIGRVLRKFYLPFDTIDVRSFNSLNKLFADGVIGYGVHKFVHLINNFTDVYYYKMTFMGRYSTFNYPHDKPYGIHHVDDLQYLFNAKYIGPMIQLDDPENIAVERLTRIWAQFAGTGNPNNSTDEILAEMNWPKHDSVNEFYLDIGTHLVEKNGLFLERFAVWDGLEEVNSGRPLKVSLTLISILLMKFSLQLRSVSVSS